MFFGFTDAIVEYVLRFFVLTSQLNLKELKDDRNDLYLVVLHA